MLRILGPSDYPSDEVAHLTLDSAETQGTVLEYSTADEEKVIVSSSGEGNILLLLHDVTATGWPLLDRLLGIRSFDRKTGEPATVLRAAGKDIVTDNVNGTPAVDTEVAVNDGVFEAASTGFPIWGRITAVDYEGNTGEYRIEVYAKPRSA